MEFNAIFPYKKAVTSVREVREKIRKKKSKFNSFSILLKKENNFIINRRRIFEKEKEVKRKKGEEIRKERKLEEEKERERSRERRGRGERDRELKSPKLYGWRFG